MYHPQHHLHPHHLPPTPAPPVRPHQSGRAGQTARATGLQTTKRFRATNDGAPNTTTTTYLYRLLLLQNPCITQTTNTTTPTTNHHHHCVNITRGGPGKEPAQRATTQGNSIARPPRELPTTLPHNISSGSFSNYSTSKVAPKPPTLSPPPASTTTTNSCGKLLHNY